ncbi:MAG TPA: tetratricopeptide repeat protein [Pseudonocardia sp.]
MEVLAVVDGGSIRGFRLGVAALIDDLSADPEPKDWAGSPADLARAARLKQTLAVEQARVGCLEEAAHTVEGVVRIYRRLALHRSARYRPELAEALSAWGLWSSRLGRREHARAALSDAVELYRDLLDRGAPGRVMTRLRLRIGLAVALSNLGLAHSDLGDHPSAAAAGEESVHVLRTLRRRNWVYRAFARRDPVGFNHCLATSVNNLGVVAAEGGDPVRAHELAEETVRLYRELATIAPVRFESELARAVHNLGLAAAENGRPDDAASATREAVALHRCLFPSDPTDHQQHLGRALCAFAQVRAARGIELAEAVDAAEEAVTIFEELAERRPEAFTGDLHAAYRAASQVREVRDGPAEPPGRTRR